MRFRFLVLAAILAAPTVASAEMSVTFDWGKIPRCTTGRPNVVNSPQFVLKDVPEGTTHLLFRMIDRDDTWADHGQKKLKLNATGDVTIPAGSFKYLSPCPKGAIHTYEWHVTAFKGMKPVITAWRQGNYPN
ncbi:hypothetical protein HJ526_00445 [Donghicola sp. C2-DW-16]|uniref:Phospholipid-binding protein n=1 Tax=Donghicola mangrovi TaxID=2729614 RepID=A0ABX2P8S5_9RHOB|nr:hypothetical protein [Donghicola mangrovi]NVO25873.1 hypothetical protein [Donghicola mangrovi]